MCRRTRNQFPRVSEPRLHSSQWLNSNRRFPSSPAVCRVACSARAFVKDVEDLQEKYRIANDWFSKVLSEIDMKDVEKRIRML